MGQLFEDFTISILKLNKLVQKIKTFEMERFGLKSIHVMCIYYLNKNPQGLTAKELGELTHEDKAAISRALKIIQNDGYVKYDPNSRNALITLTDSGKEMALTILGMADRAVMAGSVDFTEEERAFFYKSLGVIVDNLKNYYKDLVKNNG
ncbi:MAG: MarR family winged helix-turn-helix transcriptional regulator [Clostridiales bacterium]|nr:MarR family winged helix-turn-helix transcriptional regulator [Clostridiales bacterium]